jgi:hypothetical protein
LPQSLVEPPEGLMMEKPKPLPGVDRVSEDRW